MNNNNNHHTMFSSSNNSGLINNVHVQSGEVDFTLSLGDPSSSRSSSTALSSSSVAKKIHKPVEIKKKSALNNFNGGLVLFRRCAKCNTSSTPYWRKGPEGPKSLCNACGIRYYRSQYKKVKTRATSTTPTIDPPPVTQNDEEAAAPGIPLIPFMAERSGLLLDYDEEAAAPGIPLIPFMAERSGLLLDYIDTVLHM